MLKRHALPALALALLPAACAAGPNGRSATRAAEANASPEAVANARRAYASVFAAVQRAATTCEQGAAIVNDDLAAALDETQHGSPRAESPGHLMARLHAERVAFTIVFPANQWTPEVRDGIATRRQQWLGAPRDGKEQADLDEQRRTEQSVGWIADELRAQVALFGKAFADAHLDRVTCDQAAQQAAAHLLNYDRPELRDALRPELMQARELLRGVARARQANGTAEAAATGIFAAYEAAAAHDHPEIVDQALAALRVTSPVPAAIADSDVDEAVTRAVHEEAERLVRTAAERAGDASAALYLVTVTRDAEADLTGRAGPRDGVAAPQGSSPGMRLVDLRPLGDAMRSVTLGDYRSALKNAAPYVPGALGSVLVKARGNLD
jgi:hypothetical protein